jgi:ribosomal protein L29
MKKSMKEELKNLDAGELKTRIDHMRRELFSIRLNTVTKPVKDKTYFKKARRDIACALTLLREKSTL